MRQLATMLLAPFAVLIAISMIGIGSSGGTSPEGPVFEPVTSPVAMHPAKPGEAAPAEEETDAGKSSPRSPNVEESSETSDARALMFSLMFAADSSASHFPSLEVAEAARLLTRHPEVADVFIEALPDASRGLRAVLLHTFYRVEDDVLRAHLLQVHQESDPVAARLREILADRARILATLQGQADSELLTDLLGRLGAPLLQTPEIRAAVLNLVQNSEDPKIRNRALARLGKLDDPEIRDILLTTLSDPRRDATERQTAARMLMRRPGPDTTPIFLEILHRNASAPLLRFAALGLKRDGGQPQVAQALLDLLLSEQADETARKNAATALSHAVRIASPAESSGLDDRLRSALTELSQQENSGPVLVHAMGEVSRGLKGRFDDDLVGILRARPDDELRGLLVADPELHRFLEEL